MNPTKVIYNERSWSMDLVGHLKQEISKVNRTIKEAGGEQSVSVGNRSLFPDVLLFGDESNAVILQGWELKMPDTPIDDLEFFENAKIKARTLGLNSFVLWNVTYARLYIKDISADEFHISREWSDLSDILSRSNVQVNHTRWKSLALEILNYLNDLFDRGELAGRPFVDAYSSGGIASLIMANGGLVAERVKQELVVNVSFRNELNLWWDRHEHEYGTDSKENTFAQTIISNWIGKIIFANILREKDSRARAVVYIEDNTTPDQALSVFENLSQTCNFWTVFSNSLGLNLLPNQVWDEIKQLNRLLSNLRLGSIEQGQLSDILEATVNVTRRKLRGQYPTPVELSRLLVHLCMNNIATDRVLDPCCGSGTIARMALEYKLNSGISIEQISPNIFAGDQDPHAVQISTLSLTKPDFINTPLRIFQEDAFSLSPNTELSFQNPTNGELFIELLGEFDVLISNLPFVAQKGRSQYEKALQRTLLTLGDVGDVFSKRADVSAYLPFSLHPLLKDGGRMGIVITNAWLGTAWGDAFYSLLTRYYNVKHVVTSGAGRWFKNAKVVTNILILEKKQPSNISSGSINFVTLIQPLEYIGGLDSVDTTVAQIATGQVQSESMLIRNISYDNISRFRVFGLGGNAQFVNCDWFLSLPLTRLSDHFEISRGERRGLNDFFYPEAGNGIESEYIKPLIKSPKDITHLVSSATSEAFSCSLSEDELIDAGHTGALGWINRFRTEQNIKKLSRASLYWYEMKTDILSELVMPINQGGRLFVSKISPPAFVDQRLIRLNSLSENMDVDLCHALLNSSISLFMIEGMGFGRGEGVLDLNKDRIHDFMHILDFSILSDEQKASIKNAFLPLSRRSILDIPGELESPDRINFDDVVLEAFNLDISRDEIYDSLLTLFNIRNSV